MRMHLFASSTIFLTEFLGMQTPGQAQLTETPTFCTEPYRVVLRVTARLPEMADHPIPGATANGGREYREHECSIFAFRIERCDDARQGASATSAGSARIRGTSKEASAT